VVLYRRRPFPIEPNHPQRRADHNARSCTDPPQTPYRTPEGVTSNVMEILGRDWDGWAAHDDSYIVEGENVVVLARYTAVNRATAKSLDVRVAHHFVVRAGLIVRFEQFVDTAKVADAATL
jgi:ketosteroid isomerase-like protein